MRIAALDLGSNTSLLLIADVENGELKVVHDETTVTKMGQGVNQNRRFHPDALKRLDECFGRYAKTIAANSCAKIIAVATSAARDVQNGEELLKLGQRHGLPIHIISGTREAELTFRGATSDRRDSEGLAVIDVGGGSTEIISMNQGEARGTSVDVGSVRLTELFVHSDPMQVSERESIRKYVDEAFAKAPLPKHPPREVVAVAGTPTTLAAIDQAIEFQDDKINGYPLTLAQIEKWTERLIALKLVEREALPGMQPKRADVIVAGTLILSGAIRALNQTQVSVSTRGVRYGVALAWESF